MTVFIDVLIIFNLYINFFLVRSTALIMRRKISSLRCLAAAAVGALSSLVILLPPIPFILTFLIKAAIACLVTFAAFGRQKIWDHAVCMMFFLLMCFVYGGAMLALWHFAAPLGMVYENGTAYFNIPIGALAVFTAISYGTVRAVRYLLDRKVKCTENCTVAVTAGGGWRGVSSRIQCRENNRKREGSRRNDRCFKDGTSGRNGLYFQP